MTKKLGAEWLNKEDLESSLVSKWEYAPDGLYRINSSIILYCDAALQLKEKGYEAVTAIKNAGVPYAKIFEMMGYVYSEIDFSRYKRRMQEPEMDAEELEKLVGKKTILTDMDFVTGITLQKVRQYLKEREVNASGAYMGTEDWIGREFCLGPYKGFWRVEKNGLRRLNYQRILSAFNEQRRTPLPRGFEIYTSTESGTIKDAIKRVSEYIKKAGKI